MTNRRSLAEIEADLARRKKRQEAFERITSGRLSRQEEELERERLYALTVEELEEEAKRRPPPEPPVIANVRQLSREDAAAKAAALRADPRYYDPSKADANGVRLTAEEHALMVRGHQELLARAAGADE